MGKLAAVMAPVLLAACAPARQPEGLATRLVAVAPAPSVRVVEKTVPVLMAPEPAVREKPGKPDPGAVTRDANAKAMEMPRAERFIGSTLEYPLIPGAVYTVLTAVNDITAIELPPGCRMNRKAPLIGDPSHAADDRAEQQGSAGDEEPANWVIAKTFHGTPRDPVSKVVVRPNRAGLRTSLLIDSECGAFRYRLISTESSANATVRFRRDEPNMGLPLPPFAGESGAPDRGLSPDRVLSPDRILSCADTPVSQVRRDYAVSGDHPPWRPADGDIFHNGAKLCIALPDGLGELETPAISGPTGGEDMTVHYRTAGRFIEIDRILPVVELRLGDDRVRLTLKRPG
jgi:type IV secretory pathway VirB9-like protein